MSGENLQLMSALETSRRSIFLIARSAVRRLPDFHFSNVLYCYIVTIQNAILTLRMVALPGRALSGIWSIFTPSTRSFIFGTLVALLPPFYLGFILSVDEFFF